MIITRTPFRVSFAGGGSDLKGFYSKNGYGAVVSTAIKKYMYIVIHPYFHDKIRIKYSKTEDVESMIPFRHPIVRECLRRVQIERGIEIASFADVPAGTGLGSSSSFTIGLLNALYAHKGIVVSNEKLAQEACEIEIDILGEPIGKQDQYAVAYGNINHIRFNKDETVEVSPILLTELVEKRLEDSLCMYYVGGERISGDILSEQKENIYSEIKFRNLKNMVELADKLREYLYNGNVDIIGNVLHKGWLYKKELASRVSNQGVDNLYEKAMKCGATGGKLLGAGGTGFLLFHSNDHERLKKQMGCKVLPLAIDKEGAKVIFYE